MDAVVDEVLGVSRVDLERLLQSRDDRRVQVGNRRTLLFGKRPDELAISEEHLVISSFERWLSGHVIEGGWDDERDPDARQFALERLHQVLIPAT